MGSVAVIGSNSFSGSDFVDLLLEQTNFQVLGFSRSAEKSALFLPYKERRDLARFQFHQVDLNQDMRRLKSILVDLRPEYVVNFAAQSEVGPSWDHPEHWFRTNAVAIAELGNFLKDQKWLKRYVHISSPEVYGTCEGVVTEEAPVNPSTPYAASKAAGDMMLWTLVKNCNFPLVMIRATNVYGPHQQLFKIIPRSVIYLKQGRTLHLHGGGHAVKSYIHIRDVSRGELAAMLRGRLGQLYHLSPDGGVSVRDVVRTICDMLGKEFDACVQTATERLGQDKAYVIDSRKARAELNWSPHIGLQQGIEQVVQWVEAHWAEIEQQPLDYVHQA